MSCGHLESGWLQTFGCGRFMKWNLFESFIKLPLVVPGTENMTTPSASATNTNSWSVQIISCLFTNLQLVWNNKSLFVFLTEFVYDHVFASEGFHWTQKVIVGQTFSQPNPRWPPQLTDRGQQGKTWAAVTLSASSRVCWRISIISLLWAAGANPESGVSHQLWPAESGLTAWLGPGWFCWRYLELWC